MSCSSETLEACQYSHVFLLMEKTEAWLEINGHPFWAGVRLSGNASTGTLGRQLVN